MVDLLRVVVTLAVFFAASCTGVAIDTRITDEHNIDQCEDSKTATVKLYETNVYEPAADLFPVIRIISYPEIGLNNKLITCLQVTNCDTSGHGGYPNIVSGGVGAYDVQIRFTSQWGQPLNFTVEIWADEDDDEDDKERKVDLKI